MRKAILKTFVYADIFDYPLKRGEIWKKLIWQKKTKPSKFVFEKTLKTLVAQKKLAEESQFLFLQNREGLVKKRQAKRANSEKKLAIAERIAKILSFIPTVKFVGLTGSVASSNAKRTDDIDFFIATSTGWLWTTRFFVNILLMPVRRRPEQRQVKDKICLNVFVDENNLSVFSRNKNLFAAYELFQLVPLYDKNNIYLKLISQNPWAREFLPNAFENRNIKPRKNRKARNGRLIEKLLMELQLILMANKRTIEITTESLIVFHPKDRTSLVLEEFQARTKQTC